MPKWLWGTNLISVNIANMRETAKVLAMTPDTVATIANITVNHKPKSPNEGRAACASAKLQNFRNARTIFLKKKPEPQKEGV